MKGEVDVMGWDDVLWCCPVYSKFDLHMRAPGQCLLRKTKAVGDKLRAWYLGHGRVAERRR